MRVALFILALPAGALALISLVAAFTKSGSDIQLIAFGVFLVALAVTLGCIGIMSRLEQIRDRSPKM